MNAATWVMLAVVAANYVVLWVIVHIAWPRPDRRSRRTALTLAAFVLCLPAAFFEGLIALWLTGLLDPHS
jgi:hypothetical protein